ncbi:MAG: hypothetical protein NC043_08790 [Muribaculaceae bacterium]|nr:hypothetical protein [Muribaculaceae bacterium]
MKNKFEFGKGLVSGFLIIALLMCNPISVMAQSQNLRSYTLEGGSPVVLRVNENADFSNKADNGTISAIVENDVYSADGTQVVVKADTPATIEFNAESNGSWGKAGKVCMTNASTRTIDGKKVMLRLSSCKKGGSKIGGVIALSVLLFPIGLISGCMKGSMPKISNGTTFDATTTQDVVCNPISE